MFPCLYVVPKDLFLRYFQELVLVVKFALGEQEK